MFSLFNLPILAHRFLHPGCEYMCLDYHICQVWICCKHLPYMDALLYLVFSFFPVWEHWHFSLHHGADCFAKGLWGVLWPPSWQGTSNIFGREGKTLFSGVLPCQCPPNDHLHLDPLLLRPLAASHQNLGPVWVWGSDILLHCGRERSEIPTQASTHICILTNYRARPFTHFWRLPEFVFLV